MKILICDRLDKQTLQELQKIGNCIDASEEKNKKEIKIPQKKLKEDSKHMTMIFNIGKIMIIL